MATAMPLYEQFSLEDTENLGGKWKKWLERFEENYLVAYNITDAKRQKALMLLSAGTAVQDIYDTLKATGDEPDTFAQVKTKLTNHFAPQANIDFEEYKFKQAKPNPNETVDQYCTRLRQLAKNCEFHSVDKEIKSMILQNCHSKTLRRQILRTSGMSLAEVLTLARTLETSDTQALHMETDPTPATAPGTSVNATGKYTKNHSYSPHKFKPKPKTGHKSHQSCRNCGGQWPHAQGKKSCPAFGKTCLKCSKANHFAKFCRGGSHKGNSQNKSQKTFMLNETDSEEEYCFSIGNSLPKTRVTLCNSNIVVIIDTASSINILDTQTYNRLKTKPDLTKSKSKINPYGSQKGIHTIGEFNCMVQSQAGIQVWCTFYVASGNYGSLLGYSACVNLKLADVYHTINNINILSIEDNYPAVFSGIGKLKDTQIKLHINPDIQPVKQTHRRVPFHVRKQVKEEIRNLEDQDIIETVTGPTPWISPIVVAPKPKDPTKVRICIDMREANRAIERERHVTPTVDDLIHDLNGATIYPHLDLRSGYHQLELAPESRYITTFSTHLGLHRYKRLIFGISCASEIFQHAIEQVLMGIPGVKNISDDIIIYGKTQEDHDKSLDQVLQRLEKKGLTLNGAKCEFNKRSLEFFGHIFSQEGMSPSREKVQAIRDCQPPTNVKEVRSLLGMANFCARYIKDYSSLVQPLRELTKQEVPWSWSDKEKSALDKLKDALTCETTMTYFDASKPTEIYVDGSPTGLGGILLQRDSKGHPSIIAYGSRSLTDTESRYSQTEREALAVHWAILHFHLYVYGNDFVVVSDHKPLEGIYNKPSSKPTARIERWILQLQQYKFTIRYEAGDRNPADYMSRHPVSLDVSPYDRNCEATEHYVNYIISSRVPKYMSLEEVKTETMKDSTMQTAIELIHTQKWYTIKNLDDSVNKEFLKCLSKVCDELSVTDSVILRGTRLVLPPNLHKRAVDIAHLGHQGVAKTKALLREKVWFPFIDNLVDQRVKSCIPCQANTPEHRPTEPLNMTEMPQNPWSELAADFFGPLPSKEYLLVVIDEHSRFPLVETVCSTSSNSVIPILDKLFATFGTPNVLKTDNGPPWNSDQMNKFSTHLGFTYWPQANSEAERFMRVLNKTLKSANVSERPWKQVLNEMLRSYRSTPHSTTGIPPSKLLFDYEPKTLLPQITPTHQPQTKQPVFARDKLMKGKIKKYSDNHHHAKPKNIVVNDKVLVKQPKVTKLTPIYDPNPYIVVSRKGSMITAERDGRRITRNISFFKKIICDSYTPNKQNIHQDDYEDIVNLPNNPEPNDNPPEHVPVRRNPRRLVNIPARYR